MSTLVRSISYYNKRAERRSWVRRIAMLLDAIVKISTQSCYSGGNPAISAIYGPLRTSLIIMLVLFIAIFVLGAFIPIESAALAKGTIVVMSNKKTVQHLEGGVIRDILVKDGDRVREGQTLIVLNDVAPQANHAILKGELYAAQVAEARLLALKKNDGTLPISGTVKTEAAKNADLAKTIAVQQDIFLTQRETQQGKIKTLKQHIEQSNEEIVGLEAQIKSADGQMRLIAQEVAPMARLVAKGYAAKPQLIVLQRQQQELEGNKGQYLAGIAKARQAMTETELQVANTENDFATQIADEMREVQAKIADYEEKLNAAADVVQRTTIKAPYEGIVTGLKYHTVGGVIAPGTPIMDIVPQTDKLIVEAQVQPTDIDVVQAGLKTKIVFSAYKTRNMPQLWGKVVNVSADSFSAQTGSQAANYYTARIEVDAGQMNKLSETIRLYPGMPVEVFIRTGSRSFLGYLFAPINASLLKAFKED